MADFPRVEHELHTRRWSRNLGLGVVLAAFVVLVFGLTITKVTSGSFAVPAGVAATGGGQ